MGYCYDSRGRLACDVCDSTGDTRKYRCPFGWCQAVALCKRCRHEHPEYVGKAYHRERGCEASHLRYEREQAEERRLLEEGKLLRRSALWHPSIGKTKVIFRGKDGREQAYWMAPRTYDRVPLVTPATVEDYKKLGKVTRARNTDIYDIEGRKPLKVKVPA